LIPVIRELVRQEEPSLRRRALAWQFQDEWLLRFVPDASLASETEIPMEDLDAPNELIWVQIVGVQSKRLRSVVVRAHGVVSLQIDSVSDGRTGLISAGELIDAMAREFGQAGTTIDVGAMGLTMGSTSVSVWVAAENAEAVGPVKVVISADVPKRQ